MRYASARHRTSYQRTRTNAQRRKTLVAFSGGRITGQRANR
jgi:hypothetical protein